MADSEGPPRAVLIAALVLAVGLVGVILAIAATRHPAAPQPLAVPTVPAKSSNSRVALRVGIESPLPAALVTRSTQACRSVAADVPPSTPT